MRSNPLWIFAIFENYPILKTTQIGPTFKNVLKSLQYSLKNHLKTFLTRFLSSLHFSRFSNTKFAFKSTLNLCNFQKLLKSLKILFFINPKTRSEKKTRSKILKNLLKSLQKTIEKTCRNHLKTFSTRNLSNIHLFQIF